MERKKRVHGGVAAMAIILLFVMLVGIGAFIAREVMIKADVFGADRATKSVFGALSVLLNIKPRGSETGIVWTHWSDFVVMGLLFVGIVMFIAAAFSKNHFVYLAAIVLTGGGFLFHLVPSIKTDYIWAFESICPEPVQTYCLIRFIFEILIAIAWAVLLALWILSFLKELKVKKGEGDPDKSLVFGFVPGLILILIYLGFLCCDAIFMNHEIMDVRGYTMSRNGFASNYGSEEEGIISSVAAGLRDVFMGVQAGMMILFAGLWLNRPYKQLSMEEKAAAALAAKKEAESKPAPSYTQYGPQYGPQMNQQYAPQMNPQYGQQYGPQMNQQYGLQYGQQMNQQYGQQYGPQYDPQMNQQYGAQYGQSYYQQNPTPVPTPVPVPVPVPVQTAKEEAPKNEEPVKEELPPVVEPVQEVAAETFEAVQEEVPQAFEEVKEEVPQAFEEVKEEAPQAFEEVKEEAVEAFAPVEEAAAETFEAVQEEVPQAFEEVKEEVPQAFEEVKEEAAETFAPVQEAAAAFVPVQEAPAAEAPAEEAPRFKFCPNCGTPITRAGRFCPGCGFKLGD